MIEHVSTNTVVYTGDGFPGQKTQSTVSKY